MHPLFILEVLAAFSFMIAIHEGGHYLACRFFGVKVERFAIGFGPTLFARKWGETEFALLAIPLGGYCKPAGGDLSGESAEQINAKPPQPGEFNYASWWKRVVIFLAGPAMNLLSAFAIYCLLFMVLGEPVSGGKALLGYVPPGSLAAQAGLKPGDEVLSANGKGIKTYEDLGGDLFTYGKSVTLTLARGAKTLEAVITRPEKPSDPSKEVPLGLSDQTPAVVGEAILGEPARNSGVQAGDVILAVNGQKPLDWAQTAYLIRNSKSDPLELTIQRGTEVHQIPIRRVFTGDYMAIGISPVLAAKGDFKKVPLGDAFADASMVTLSTAQTMLTGIGRLVTGKISLVDSVSGPITMMRMMYSRAAEKISELFNLVAAISLMLCIMNLLPIPVVDGGQIVLCLAEGLKRGPVPLRIQMVYQQVGFVLIVGLMALAVFNDFKNIFLEIHNHIR